MLRTRLAAAILATSLLSTTGCMGGGGLFGGGNNDGCNTGHCGHGGGGGLFSRWGMGSQNNAAPIAAPVYGGYGGYGGGYGGADCPCSYKGGPGVFQPAILPQGVTVPSMGNLPPGAIPSGSYPGAMSGGMPGMSGMEGGPVTTLPPQAVTTPGLPPGAFPTAPSNIPPGAYPMNPTNPMPPSVGPRIEPIPATPSPMRPMPMSGPGAVSPSAGFATPAPWGPQ